MSDRDVTQQFANDNQALLAAAQQYRDDEAKLEAAEKYYKEEILKKLESIKDPLLLLMMLLNGGVFASDDQGPNADGNITGIKELKATLSADKLSVQGALTKCGNDIENASNDHTSTDASSSKSLEQNAYAMDDLMDELAPGGKLDGILDSTAMGAYLNNIATIRHDIHIVGDDQYNQGDDYHLSDDSSDGKIHSYKELFDDSQLPQTSSDPSDPSKADPSKGARDAMKLMTDAFQQNTAQSQSVNSALNIEMNETMNDEKNILSFFSELLHSYVDVVKVAVTNYRAS